VLKKISEKRCKSCGNPFIPLRPLQRACSPDCAIKISRQKGRDKAEKAVRQDDRRRKEALKSKSDHRKDTQHLFNAYIRLRDMHKPCISCGQSPYQGQRHASHYRSRAAASQLAYNFLNVWASCSQCNAIKSGNILEFRIALTKILTPSQLDSIEHNNEMAFYTVEDLKRLQGILKRRIKHYKKLRDVN
jgi:hypothetical protein